METFSEAYKSGAWIEPFLILSIMLFIVASIVLYLMIIKSRAVKIRCKMLEAKYSAVIEKFLFSTIFQDLSYAEIKDDITYKILSKNNLFRTQMIKAVINLHQNYEGVYAQKLERFYFESGLIKDSFKKLKSTRWEVNCKGIKELAEMNISKSFSTMVKMSKARNKTLKITALNACIKLGGTKGIVHLVNHKNPIDEWTQVNIIHAFKKHDIGDTQGVELLLESDNSTVVTLGLKLIKELKLSQKSPYVARLATNASNALIKLEAQNVLQALIV